MPSVSKSQMRFFKMLEYNPAEAKKHGITPAKASEFTKENIGSKSYTKLPEIKHPRFKKLFDK